MQNRTDRWKRLTGEDSRKEGNTDRQMKHINTVGERRWGNRNRQRLILEQKERALSAERFLVFGHERRKSYETDRKERRWSVQKMNSQEKDSLRN